jgi:hypothetical protein
MNLRLDQQKHSRSQECSMPMVLFICLYIHVARGLSPGTPTFSDKGTYKLYTQLAELALTCSELYLHCIRRVFRSIRVLV